MTRDQVMTYIKALKSQWGLETNPTLQKAIEESIYLLEMQIPKKVKNDMCPICFAEADWYFCKNCGQKFEHEGWTTMKEMLGE